MMLQALVEWESCKFSTFSNTFWRYNFTLCGAFLYLYGPTHSNLCGVDSSRSYAWKRLESSSTTPGHIQNVVGPVPVWVTESICSGKQSFSQVVEGCRIEDWSTEGGTTLFFHYSLHWDVCFKFR